MSNLINPLLVHDYIDDNDNESAQGCFIGSDYFPIEQAADKAVREERNRILHLASLMKEHRCIDARIEEARRRRWYKRLSELIERKNMLIKFLGYEDTDRD